MKDILGNEIEVGDAVAAAIMVYRRAELRYGDVVELVPDKNKIRVKWKTGYRMNGVTTLIEVTGDKVLTIK